MKDLRMSSLEFKAIIGSALDDVGGCVLVLADKTDGDDYAYEVGWIIARIRAPGCDIDLRDLLKKLPGGNTGLLFDYFLRNKGNWAPCIGVTAETAEFLVAGFPLPCNGADNDMTPNEPSQWVGYDAVDGIEEEDFVEEAEMYHIDQIYDLANRHFIDAVVAKDGGVMFRSQMCSDLDSAIIYGAT
jgi:hypothetical protein